MREDEACDVVVVGAGSAGCVLADRLSAGGRLRVAVLEAGGSDRRFWLQVPIGYGRSFYEPRVNWMFRTEPDPGLAGRAGYWPRGKVLGGSSSINAMVWVRGQREDFDGWESEGNPGWGWADMERCYRTVEGGPATGGSGPLHVTDVAAEAHPLCDAWIRAGAELGFAYNPDFNGPSQEGVGLYRITTRDGRRMSAARAFLRPAMRRPGLRVVTGAHATRVVFEGARAVGVVYRRGGAERLLRAATVVLAAGAVGSPQLLQLSGVGPPGLLRRHGIAVRRASPAVGANLQDHLGLDYFYRSRVPTLNGTLRPWGGRLRVGARWLLARTGPLALSLNQGGGFVRTRPELERPNMQLYFQPLSYTRAPPGVRPLMSPDPFPGFLLGFSPCRPTSRGRLGIRSADPAAPPVIEPNSLATDHDVREMLEGARLMRRLAATAALSAIIEDEIAPGPGVVDEDALIDDIRRRASTVFHPVATCRMGPDPAASVVDARLRVHGVDGLRVVDASVIPTLPSGNTNAPAIVVGARGAEIILEDLLGAHG